MSLKHQSDTETPPSWGITQYRLLLTFDKQQAWFFCNDAVEKSIISFKNCFFITVSIRKVFDCSSNSLKWFFFCKLYKYRCMFATWNLFLHNIPLTLFIWLFKYKVGYAIYFGIIWFGMGICTPLDNQQPELLFFIFILHRTTIVGLLWNRMSTCAIRHFGLIHRFCSRYQARCIESTQFDKKKNQ